MQGDLLAPETVDFLTRNTDDSPGNEQNRYNKYAGGRNNNQRWDYPYWNNCSSLAWGASVNNDRHHGVRAIASNSDARRYAPGDPRLSYRARFWGPGHKDYSMTGFAEDEANWSTAGGAVQQGSGSEFNDQLKRANANFQEGSCTAPGLSLTIIRPRQR
jgi:hypothetical protein